MALRSFYQVTAVPVHSCLLVETREAALAFPRGDLELGFCAACGFIQNRRFDPSLLDYSPTTRRPRASRPASAASSTSSATTRSARTGCGGKTVLEIGCGKGEFLVALCERAGCRGIGIDPGYRPERTDGRRPSGCTFIQRLLRPGAIAT